MPSANRSRASTTTPSAFARAHGRPPRRRSSSGDPSVALARAAVVPTVAHGHRDRRSPDQGIVEPDHRARDRARLSLRLAPGQDPDRGARRSCARTSRRTCRGDSSSTFRPLEGAPAWETDPTGPAFDATTRALRAGFGVDPVLMGVGGSIPFVGPFADAFGGIPALLLGPADPRQPHPRRGREPAPRRLAQADPVRGVPPRGAASRT